MERRGHDGGLTFSTAVDVVLAHLAEALDLETWVVARVRDEDWVVLGADDRTGTLAPGTVLPWADTICARMVDGRGPRSAPVLDEVPAYVEAREALGLQVGAYVAVPLAGEDGRALGTLCGMSRTPRTGSLDEVEALLDVLGGLLGALLSSELRLARTAADEAPAQRDPLTGLVDRRGWDRALSAEEARCTRYGSRAAVVVVDLTGLREVNDRAGHPAGDAVLRRAATTLLAHVRPFDVVARTSGDRFGVLLPECDAATAEVVAARLRRAVADAGAPAAVGVAVRDADGLRGTWARADAAMADDKRRSALTASPARALAAAAGPPDGGLVQELLDMARLRTGADIAFVARFEGDQRVMRALSSAGPLSIGPGASEDLSGTYCAKIVSGVLPRVIPDSAAEPEALALPITAALPIGAYVGVPVSLPDGLLYGTLCCVSRTPRPDLGNEDSAFLEAVAGSIAHVLEAEEAERAERSRILADLDVVLGGTSLTMVYQPLRRLADGAQVGVEALARFAVEPVRTPDVWFADAGRVGLETELELVTARTALDQSTHLPGLVAVNLSAPTMCSPGFAALLAGRDLTRLVVEVSEHEEIDDYDALVRALAPWRARGLRVAVDDAGAGFASLRHVVRLTPELIKLDISLVRGIEADPVRQALAAALTSFGRQAGAQVLAEGVETEQERDALLAVGVELGQGWFLGRPGPLPPLPVPRASAEAYSG